MDYYEILNIPRGASDQDIKRAYRKLAMTWHPDKNKNNVEEANDKFQEISQAYDVLSDPEKRAIFDQHGYDGLRNGVPDANGDMKDGYSFNNCAAEDIFNDFFGTSNPFSDFGFGDTMPFASTLKKKGPEKAPPIECNITCTLEDIFIGCIKKISICRQRLVESELVEEEKEFTVKILPGWKSTTTVTFEAEGNEGLENTAGDIIIQVVTQKHDLFVRDGNDLIYTAKIKLSDALADCCVEVPTLDGRKLPIACNEVLNPSSEKIVKDEGMPYSDDGGKTTKRGQLKMKFDIKFPKYLTDLQKKSIVKILG